MQLVFNGTYVPHELIIFIMTRFKSHHSVYKDIYLKASRLRILHSNTFVIKFGTQSTKSQISKLPIFSVKKELFKTFTYVKDSQMQRGITLT